MNISVRDEMVAATCEKLFILLVNKVDIAENLKELGINNICIYGMGKLGRYLYRLLENTDINVVVCVDNNTEITHDRAMLITAAQLDLYDNKIDYYIVTSEFYYEEISSQLKNRYDTNVVLFRNLIDEMLFMNECYS